MTDADGRCRDLAADAPAGDYRLTFDTGSYFKRLGRTSIYPEIAITFTCDGKGALSFAAPAQRQQLHHLSRIVTRGS